MWYGRNSFASVMDHGDVCALHAASAKAFAQERILGGSHKRSAEMLLPTRKQLPSHGPPSAYSGRALKPVQ